MLDDALIVTLVSTGAAVIVISTVFVTVTPLATAVAVIVADPAATPVTSPLDAPTLAVPVAEDAQVIVALITAPF